MKVHPAGLLFAAVTLMFAASTLPAAQPLRALIIDGQNNHDWKNTTPVLMWILEDSGRFTVTVFTAPSAVPRPPQSPKGPLTLEQQAAHGPTLATGKVTMAALKVEELPSDQPAVRVPPGTI